MAEGNPNQGGFDEYDHDFDPEEPVCLNCGDLESNCECEEFDADPDTESVCVVCGLPEDDPMHGQE